MITNYLTVAYRNLLRNKTFSIINILGLAIGMTACLFILQYVRFERSYDAFHKLADNIYRVTMDRYVGGEFKFKSAKTYPAIAPRLNDDFGEVVDYVRLLPDHGILADQQTDKRFYEHQVFVADASFFQVFSIDLLQGVPNGVLEAPNSIVLSHSTAVKYFGNEEGVGRILNYYKDDGTQEIYKVTGVFEDIPANSHFNCDALISYSTLLQRYAGNNSDWRPSDDSWEVDDYYTYVLLNENAVASNLEKKLPEFFNRYKEGIFKARDVREELHLQPLRKIHLYSDLQSEIAVTGNYRFVYYLELIAAFIMVIAWINYINLTTAKASTRGKEVGVRKVFGSHRTQLVSQFLFESVLMNILALLMSLMFYELTLPFFQTLVGSVLPATIFEKVIVLGIFVGLSVSGIVLSSFYPAVILAGFKPISALKGRVSTRNLNFNLRKGLVLFQFIVAILMIAGVLTIRQQISFMKSQDLGFDSERLVVVKAASYLQEGTEQAYEKRAVAFKNLLLQHSQVLNITESGFVPGQQIVWRQGLVRSVGSDPGTANTYYVFAVDELFFETYGMEVVAGEVFSQNFMPSDAVIINEAAARQLSFAKAEDAVGEEIYVEIDGHNKGRIAGVVKNYHHLSLSNNFQPQIFFYRAATWSYFTVKVAGQNLPDEINIIKREFTKAFPENPFAYFFLDQFFDAQYQADQRFGKIFALFSLLAIFISCLGLFGLSSYAIVQRTKEIAIHKVLGASIVNIITLLSKDIVKLVLLAGVLALPVIYVAASHWLDGYAFHIEITWWLLVTPVAIGLLLTSATIIIQTVRAARSNSSKSLRYE
jgi:putative ABC transport system permease protein